MSRYIVRGISLPYTAPAGEAEERAAAAIRAAGATPGGARICRRSVDARRKKDIRFVYSVICEVRDGDTANFAAAGITAEREGEPELVYGSEPLEAPPVICGFGPAGMFAALLLCENGYRPVVCERGPDTRGRREAVARFNATGMLMPDANIQFGAGGAGTFSDGKLMTRINDGLCRYVLERLHEFGAPDDILVNARPHIGTNLLCGIVDKLAERVVSLGGRICYNTRIDSWEYDASGRVRSLKTNAGELACGAFILACGHSSRDTYGYLLSRGENITAKPISLGFRIEHLRADIDRALYGEHAGDPLLGAAEYNLSTHLGDTGVYTFCMCPGGEVVAAASEEGGVVTNGASRFARDGVNSNSAVAVSCAPDDPMELQRRLERAAFAAGGGGYAAPVQTLGDFLAGKSGTQPRRIMPTYARGTRLCDIGALLPPSAAAALRDGLRVFGGKLDGFDAPDACLTGLETRTSAPYRITRGEDMTMPAHDNVYPCGEGAGYAGGITSAAVDGIKAASALMKRYKRKD